MYLLNRCIDVLVPVLRGLPELGFYGRMPFLHVANQIINIWNEVRS